jgi:hypothetical protein
MSFPHSLDAIGMHPGTTVQVILQHRPMLIIPIHQRRSGLGLKVSPRHGRFLHVDTQGCTDVIDHVDAQEAGDGIEVPSDVLGISKVTTFATRLR